MYLTATKLYNYLQCSHKVWRDIYGPQNEKIEVNDFLKLIWEMGIVHEAEVISTFNNYVDLKDVPVELAFKETMKAIEAKAPVIYQGVLEYGNLRGRPDLLTRTDDGQYIPIDIKSGRGMEGLNNGENEGKLKKHYAVQLCLYAELLQRLGFLKANFGRIFDKENKYVDYPLNQPMNKTTEKSFFEFYGEIKDEVDELINNRKKNLPALGGSCKLCWWYESCKKWGKENQDLTLLFYLGRSKRDTIVQDLGISKVGDLISVDIEEAMRRKKLNKNYLYGIGKSTLDDIVRRAYVLTKVKKPIIRQKITFPVTPYEIFFDIEDDPLNSIVYFHGLYVRFNDKEEFKCFVSKGRTKEQEKTAWNEFWLYIRSLPKNSYTIYYYSHHERTVYNKLLELYPDIVTKEELDAFFSPSNAIDLYKVIVDNTDWPLGSYSIKEIATYLGFSWRDKTPSGALSIEWFNKYLDTGDESILNRIKEYNEDDCKATLVVKDYLSNHAVSITEQNRNL